MFCVPLKDVGVDTVSDAENRIVFETFDMKYGGGISFVILRFAIKFFVFFDMPSKYNSLHLIAPVSLRLCGAARVDSATVQR